MRVTVRADTERGTYSMRVSKTDLGTMFGTETARVKFTLGGIAGADWDYQITMRNNRTGTTKRY